MGDVNSSGAKPERVLMMKRTQQKLRSTTAQGSRHKRLLASIAAAGFAGSGTLALADDTTTLTGLGNTNADVPVNHGSTAETTLTWGTEWDQYADWDGRGDVYQVDQLVTTVVFTPAAANIAISIDSFDIDEWAGGGDTSVNADVTGPSSGMLNGVGFYGFNNANDPNDLGGRFTVNFGGIGAPGEPLTLTFDHSAGGSISYLAIDNLTFSSRIVPEPASAVLAWLGVGGLGALAMRRKR